MKPKLEFLYKYRPVIQCNNLESDYYIDALIKNYAIFSSRINFNDIFDSKIYFKYPTVSEFKSLYRFVPTSMASHFLSCYCNDAFTLTGEKLFTDLENQMNKMYDSYPIFSLSANPVSNILWGNYASNHTGFCIKFKNKIVNGKNMNYSKSLPEFDLLEIVKRFYGINNNDFIGEEINRLLLTKNIEWFFENEYRIIGSRGVIQHIPEGMKFIKHPYDPESIESIIFGCRMEKYVKEYIIKKVHPSINKEQAAEKKGYIKIVPFDIKEHLK